ncbi:DUF4188 domain-containing protein [Rhodococcus sp. H36-A4]|uniref:DUF4188 domain-containing protein n=1 Tax=unclassified Rhodococcus (in: high G+C Gram-positive bacteria) TaxID=192944 RepID=UPI00109D8FAF|nr:MULTISPECIES: DUF4188 domain-containing protein [unclassified Rhodococcus (in: high G+C Gram-positive bacteria)]MCZ4080013.1 DUF4188 domain-containing protein [Rhodococcus sp. H36-A4]QCB51927.1 DUF4188 domain-containing protein [Rhodococcus sp. PAMC28705]QCB59903.1 DUF4188 domain-containing protein [Rhodococcus sp. PAMC28707]
MIRSRVQTGRYTAVVESEFVVFLIGIRLNKLWKIHKWIGPFLAMPRMLQELQQHPDKGLLGARMSLGGRTITVVQYWRSFDQLEAFAKNPNDPHLPAWKAFNKRVGAGGDVGVYHETYRVSPGQHESIYSNMPIMGLAAAGRSVAVGKRSETARARIAGS